MIFFYNFITRVYYLLIKLASLFHPKAKKWIEGRQSVFSSLEKQITNNDKVIWMHCSSAGEFEQGKPVLEALKIYYPGYKILVSFFSPSGYEVAGNYSYADIICYLPADTRNNASKFLTLVHPSLVIFIKYEFWFHHLSAAAYRHIPVILVSAVFRKDQVFFTSFGKAYRQVLFLFRHIFVQDRVSLELLLDHQVLHCSLGGDTRFDRVSSLSAGTISLPLIEFFLQEEKVFVAGSTWPADEKLLAAAFSSLPPFKLIIVPHEISEEHLSEIKKLFPGSVRYSALSSAFSEENNEGLWSHINREEKRALQQQYKKARVLIIDNTGMLSRLYFLASVCYVGGGFSKDGIHNVLEPAVFGKPVLFGPNYKKYREAKELVELGAAFSTKEHLSLKEKTEQFMNDGERISATGEKARSYIEANTGATSKVLDYIQENRLLTI